MYLPARVFIYVIFYLAMAGCPDDAIFTCMFLSWILHQKRIRNIILKSSPLQTHRQIHQTGNSLPLLQTMSAIAFCCTRQAETLMNPR